MKPAKNIKKKLIRNVKAKQEWINKSIEGYVGKVEEAETVEEMMRSQKRVLVELLERLPLRPEDCYFCVLHVSSEDCEECEYGEIHRICNEESSDFGEIRRRYNELIEAIEALYYRGEEY